MGDGDTKTAGASLGSFGSVGAGGGVLQGQPAVGGTTGAELFMGGLPGGFDLNPVFFGDYVIDDFSNPARRDPRLVPRDAYLRIDQEYMSLRGGRLPFLGGNLHSIDGAEVFVRPYRRIHLGGFVGMRNETVLAPGETAPALQHRHRGLAYGAEVQGGVGGFDARVFYRGIADQGRQTREDLGGEVNWRILPGLSAYGYGTGSLLLQELEKAGGGLQGTWGPAMVRAYFDWNDPSLLYFDADDPWLVFANAPFWKTGGDVSLSLMNGMLLVNAGGLHGSAVDYGITGGAQYGNADFVRLDGSYLQDSRVIGGQDHVAAWLSGGLDFEKLKTLASVGYVQAGGQVMPLFSQGDAVGFLLQADAPVLRELNLGGRFEGSVSDQPFQYNALLFLQWRPEIAKVQGISGRYQGSWQPATVQPASVSVPQKGLSWVVFPVQVITAGAYGENYHSLHADAGQSCVDCHENAPSSRLAADNLAVVSCDSCHDAGRSIKVELRDPRLHFPHATHVTDQKIECERCHGDMTKTGLATRDNLPSMAVCTSCHVTWRNECAKCHPAGSSGRMQSVFAEGKLAPSGSYGIEDSHTLNFRKDGGHRRVAATHLDYCLNCHSMSLAAPGEPAACQECHDPLTVSAKKHHPAGWVVAHPSAVRQDSLSCSNCHETSYCSDCHASKGIAAGMRAMAPRSYHPAGWVTSSGGDHGSRAMTGGLSCAPCHSVSAPASTGGATSCTSCHSSMANPHGTGLDVRLSRLKEVNPGLCRTCHPQ